MTLRKILMYILALCLVLCLTSCGETVSESSETGFLYYLNENGESLFKEEYFIEATDTMGMIEELLDKLLSEQAIEGEAAPLFSKKVELLGYTFDDNLLKVDLSDEYLSVSAAKELLQRAGLVKTMVQLPDVKKVEILVEGNPLTDSEGEEIGALKNSSFVENASKDINTYKKQTMKLYFADSTGKNLSSEEKTVYYSSNVPLERVVVEKIAAGPSAEGLKATLPQDVSILSVTMQDEICYVNFGDSFSNITLSVKPEVIIYSIVDSLDSVCDVKKVQFSINGDSNVKFRGAISLNQLFTPDYSLLTRNE